MSKYSNELKMEIVQYVIGKNHSYGEASTKYGITKEQIQKWVKLYKYHGTGGLCNKNYKYSGEFKINVIEYMHNTKSSVFDTAAYFGIPSRSTVSNWERIYYEEGAGALHEERRGRGKKMGGKSKKKKMPKETEEDLIAEVQRLRMEVAYLKKLNALVQERKKSEKKIK